MKLIDVFRSAEAWKRLSGLKKPPRMAYSLMRYFKSIQDELDIIEKERVNCIRRIAKAGENEAISLKPGSAEIVEFESRFIGFLESESVLVKLSITMDELINALENETDNTLTEKDLLALEPFFS